MCNFLITNILDIKDANKYQKYRGPDYEKQIIFNNILFMHNLLSITGDFYPQPYENENIIICFNGEIYNYKEFGNFKSDVESISFLYENQGIKGLKLLEGEFAIAVYDKKQNIFYLVHDLFAIKPLYVGIKEDKFCISSYPSASKLLGIENITKISPNSIFTFDKELIKIDECYKWDLKQYKTTYDDFYYALEQSVLKRVQSNKEILVNLSSGYDSGVICCVLNKYGIKYNTASILGKENKEILEERIKINKKYQSQFNLLFEEITEEERKELMKYINENTEDIEFSLMYGKKDKGYNFKNDKAIIGASKIYSEVRDKYNIRIALSGSGADEIFADYGFQGKKHFGHSGFGGLFPEKLEEIFPKNTEDRECIWKHFYFNCNECYLWKEEVITGLYGIEGRFPFLDKQVIQEFLNLDVSLKNKEYKGLLKEYLIKNKYPFTEKKIGFNI